jgi:peptidoglycan glycosyltransferase
VSDERPGRSGINVAIGRLWIVFVACFAILAGRQVWLQVFAAERIASDSHNPRTALLTEYRGTIRARDGAALAYSTKEGRIYPYGAMFAHSVGYLSSRYGSSGLEHAFDVELKARPAPVDALAQARAIFGAAPLGANLRGADIITTLDPAIQRALYDDLSRYPRAAGVVLDPRTGDVLALASVPSYDPASIDRDFPALRVDAQSRLLDRSIDGLYPPGSTFKIFTAASALDAGVVDPEEIFHDPGRLTVGSFIVHDNEGEATGAQTLAGAFALSSNVDFAEIALRLGVERWFGYAQRWKLGEPFGFELPAERDRLPDPAAVSPSILAQLGFGQASLLVTPLRMALVAATIANDGTTPRPLVVRAIRPSGASERRLPHSTLTAPISPQTAGAVRDLMRAVVTRGTGSAAALGGVEVAGKTGTATNPAGRPHAWFVAFAPAEKPRVAVAIVIENAGYGGVVAAPIARRVLSAALERVRS